MLLKKCRLRLPQVTLDHLWIAAPFFVMIVRAIRVPLPLIDFWWHLKMGEIIVSTHSIPRTDLFSFTAAGKPFLVQNWLAEILYLQLYRMGGFPSLILLNTLVLAAALLPVFLLCRESTRQAKTAAACTLLSCVAFAVNARPQVFSLILFAVFYWILDGYRFQRRDRLWVLPAAMVLWVNLHGAFVVGLGLIALFLVSETARRLFEPDKRDVLSPGQLKKLAIVFLASAGATLANPAFFGVYDYIRIVLSDQASQRLVMEWQPPRIASFLGIQMFFGLFALAIFGLIYSRKPRTLTDLLLFLGFSIFGLTALRNTAWFAIVVAPIIGRYWTEIDKDALPQPFGSFTKPAGSLESGPARKQHYGLNLVISLIALLIVVLLSPWLGPTIFRTHLLDRQTPVKALDYVQQHGLSGHIFHPQIFGDYLIWRLYPKQKSFIDGRVHLFGETFVRNYQELFSDSHWEEQLAGFKIQYLLLSKDPAEVDSAMMIRKAESSGHWIIIFEDSVSVLLRSQVPHQVEATNNSFGAVTAATRRAF